MAIDWETCERVVECCGVAAGGSGACIAHDSGDAAAYRWTSGYGLRASRSLAVLAAVVIAATIAFHAWLVEDPPRWAATLLFSLRSTVSFVREPRLEGMTLAGEYVQLGLPFAGPVLLALTVLAIRARVRR